MICHVQLLIILLPHHIIREFSQEHPNRYFDFDSYIQDTQIFGDCTPETYIHALRHGCRAVESRADE